MSAKKVVPIHREETTAEREARLAKEYRGALEARWRRQALRDRGTRLIFESLPDSPQKSALKLAMLERAWWMFEGSEGEGNANSRLEQADALLAFLPERDVETILREFFDTENQFNPDLYRGHYEQGQADTSAASPPAEQAGDEAREERQASPMRAKAGELVPS